MGWIVMMVAVAGVGIAAVAWRTVRHHVATGGSDFWRWLDMELERARRYDHTVSIIRVTTGEGRFDTSANQLRCLRAMDHSTSLGDELWVLAPETDTGGAEALVDRLSHELGHRDLSVRVASFPLDGITRHALIEHIEGLTPTVHDRRRVLREAS